MNTITTATYLEALAHVTAGTPHYFTCTEVAGVYGTDSASDGLSCAVERLLLEPSLSADMTSTLLDCSMGSDDVAAVCVGTEEHLGYIIMHYTTRGDIVRFVAIRES